MTERGKIFNTDDVKAIQENRKTMFRVPVKPQPPGNSALVEYKRNDYDVEELRNKVSWFVEEAGDLWPCNREDAIRCPFGQIGDRIYVRETFCDTCGEDICYRENMIRCKRPPNFPNRCHPWKNSSCMPKKYARLWLEITDIRVERVQDITQDGFKAEGINDDTNIGRKVSFIRQWNPIYKNWSDNPWVWVTEFKVVKK